MKILFHVVLLSLMMSCAVSQNRLVPKQKRVRLLDQTYLKQHNFLEEKSHGLEIRFWKRNYASGQHKVLRLTQDKNHEWQASSLEYYCYNHNSCDADNPLIKGENAQGDWTRTWGKIIQDSLLWIRPQQQVNQSVNTYGAMLVVGDGGGYRIEVIDGRKKWAVSYDNLDSHREFLSEFASIPIDYIRMKTLIEEMEACFDLSFNTSILKK
ncbi:MAG: hypothetical protein AAF206_01810 [Bacteroidota bacterium]